MESEVTGAVALCFAQPKFECGHGVVVARRANHFDERRCAADQGCFAGRFVSVLGKCPHERQINMDMRINKSWEDEFASRVNDFRPGRRA